MEIRLLAFLHLFSQSDHRIVETTMSFTFSTRSDFSQYSLHLRRYKNLIVPCATREIRNYRVQNECEKSYDNKQ